MLTDYELFLMGCYSAVVEINYENDDIYKFMDLMESLGLKKYTDYLRKIDEKHSLIDNARYNGIKHLCIEYQIGKGFTWGDKQEYLKSCEETKVLSLEDLIKSVGKEEEYFLDYKDITLKDINSDFEVLDEFCNMYGWLPIKCGKGYNIKDIEFDNVFVEDKCYKTIDELVDRIVCRAIDYFRNETEFEQEYMYDNIKYGLELYIIAIMYEDKHTEYNEEWLESFKDLLEELLEDFKKYCKYVVDRNKVCGTSKRDLFEEYELEEQLEELEEMFLAYV